MNETQGNIEFAFHAAGIGAGHAAGRGSKRKALEESIDTLFKICSVEAVQLALESQVLAARAAFIHTRFLSDATDGAADALGFAQDIDACHAGFAGIGPGKRGEDFD